MKAHTGASDSSATRHVACGLVLAGLLGLLAKSPVEAGINQWTSNGPVPGFVTSLAIDPQAPGILYAGTLGGEVFKSTDGGDSWSPSTSGLGTLAVLSLAINPSAPDHLFAGTIMGGVFRSTDGGVRWHLRNSGLAGPEDVNVLAIDPLIDPGYPDHIFAGTSNGLFESWEGGHLWDPVGMGLTCGRVNAIAIDHPSEGLGAAYYGTSCGVFRDPFSGPLSGPILGQNIQALAIDPRTPTTVYAGRLDGVFQSPDGGTSGWFNTFLPTTSTVTALVINPQRPTVLYAATDGDGVFRGTVLGPGYVIRWTPLNLGLTETRVTALAIDPQTPSTLYAATNGSGVFRIDQISPDLALTMTGGPDPVKRGTNLTYTITVTNRGPGAVSRVEVADRVPPGATFVSATPTQGSCTRPSKPNAPFPTLRCSLGTIASGARATISLIVIPTVTIEVCSEGHVLPGVYGAPGLTMCNTASVSSGGGGFEEPELNLANNTRTAVTTLR